ncbi:MAG: hypothetical protein ACRDF7_02630 [Candidatus Limnocylindrales bacterium]
MPSRNLALTFALALAASLVAACGAGAATPTPDPSAPCPGIDEQRAPGLYPDLEALLPATLEGHAPVTLDSGRYCSAKTLGSLLAAGVAELRFAGATWPDDGGQTGIAMVVYRAPGLTVDAVADSFASGAGTARGVNQVHAEAIDFDGQPGVRVTAMSGDRPQIVIIRSYLQAGTIAVVIGSGVTEARVRAAAEVFYAP